MNKKRVIWLVPVLVMALGMSACKSEDDDDGGGGIGETLRFADEEVFNKNGSPYIGDKSLTVDGGGTGLIKGGKLTFTIGRPNSMKSMTLLLRDIDARLGYNVFSYASNEPDDTLAFELIFANLKKTSLTLVFPMEAIRYIWVEKDCVVKSPDTGIHPVTINGISVEVSKFTLKLKKGWNAVGLLVTPAIGGTLSPTLVIGTGDSDNCKWVYE